MWDVQQLVPCRFRQQGRFLCLIVSGRCDGIISAAVSSVSERILNQVIHCLQILWAILLDCLLLCLGLQVSSLNFYTTVTQQRADKIPRIRMLVNNTATTDSDVVFCPVDSVCSTWLVRCNSVKAPSN